MTGLSWFNFSVAATPVRRAYRRADGHWNPTAVNILPACNDPGYEALPRNPLTARLHLVYGRQASAFPGRSLRTRTPKMCTAMPLEPYRLELLFAFLLEFGRVEPDFLRAFLLSA